MASIPPSPADEVARLRGCLNDLVSLMGLPAIWGGSEPAQIVTTLLDALIGMLGLAFVFAKLNGPDGGPAIEMVRTAAQLEGAAQPQDLRAALGLSSGPTQWVARAGVRVDNIDFRLASARLGLQEEIGVVIAGSQRLDFPTQTETLLFEVATNQAALRLQQARFLSAQRRIAIELDERVAQRTSELAAANQELKIEIAERRRAESALADSARESRLIIDTIPALAWAARPDGTAAFFNQHYLNFVGLSAEQATGWDWMTAVHPADCDELTGAWQRIMSSGEAGATEARLRRFDGEYRWFLFRTNPLRDESGTIVKWYGINTDIEERKQAEEALRRSEAFLAEAQRISSTGSFSWRLDTDAIIFSEELYRIFELDEHAVITLEQIGRRVHPDDLPLLSELIDRIRASGDNPEYEIRLLMPDGRIKHIRTFSNVIHHPDARRECLGAMQDVTQRRLSEEALDKARSELAHVARSMSLGALTASIAHEVNQPLSGIITNASTCVRMLTADPPNVDGALETVRRTIRDGNRAADVIAGLRALFGKKAVATETVDLNDAAREVISLLAGTLQRSRVMLRAELDDDSLLVTGDRVQLQQVILNLVRNASDAMSGVDDRPRQLLIRTQRDHADHVRLTVQDVGIGLDPKGVERLFDAFYTTKSDSMGIGLSVSRSIIERHRGRLWALSNEGPGATFAFSIPCRFEAVVRAPDSGVHGP